FLAAVDAGHVRMAELLLQRGTTKHPTNGTALWRAATTDAALAMVQWPGVTTPPSPRVVHRALQEAAQAGALAVHRWLYSYQSQYYPGSTVYQRSAYGIPLRA